MLLHLLAGFTGLAVFGACVLFFLYTILAVLTLVAVMMAQPLTLSDKGYFTLALGIVIIWGGWLVHLSWQLGSWLLTF